MKRIITSILILIMCIGFTAGCAKEENIEKTDAIRFKEDYESLNGVIREKDGKTIRTITINENNPMVYKTADEIVEAMDNKETFIVYFGFTDCPWCRSVLPTLIDVAQEANIDKIYYVDIKEIRDTKEIQDGKVVETKEGSEGYKKLLEKLDKLLDKYTLTNEAGKKIDTKEKRIFAPNIVAVKNGEAIKLTEGISDKQKDGYEELTEEMQTDMYNKLKCVMECVSSENNTCSKDKC